MDSEQYDQLLQMWRLVAPYGDEKDLPAAPFDFVAHLKRQRAFSEKTFGPGPRTVGISKHIRKELLEIEEAPFDLKEWIDVVILALDGAWRSGASPEQVVAALVDKQTENEGRTWPRNQSPDVAVEHDRTVAPAKPSAAYRR